MDQGIQANKSDKEDMQRAKNNLFKGGIVKKAYNIPGED